MYILPETELLKTKYLSTDKNAGTFAIEPLMPGYGMTAGNAIRRILLSSLSGAAITSVKIEGVTHEFSVIKGVKEDAVELILNLKNLKVKLLGEGPEIVKLSKKGPGLVKAADFSKNANVVFADPEHVLANLDKQAQLNLEITVEKGRGYLPTEKRLEEKLPLGTIAVDAIFTPIKRVQYEVENTRVGGKTDYDKLTINITTDGTIEAKAAMNTALQILLEHFSLIKEQLQEVLAKEETAAKKVANKKAKKSPDKVSKSKSLVNKPVAKKPSPAKKTVSKKTISIKNKKSSAKK